MPTAASCSEPEGEPLAAPLAWSEALRMPAEAGGDVKGRVQEVPPARPASGQLLLVMLYSEAATLVSVKLIFPVAGLPAPLSTVMVAAVAVWPITVPAAGKG